MCEERIFIRAERNCARREAAGGTFAYGKGLAEAKASREKGVNS